MTHRKSIQDAWHVREMAEGFATAALWADGEALDRDPETGETGGLEYLTVDDESMDAIRALCALFYAANAEDLEAYSNQYAPVGNFSVWECAGHDLYLTGARHGCGFFDRGLSDLGDRLSDACSKAPFDGIEHCYPFQVDADTATFDNLPTLEIKS